jgi:hypothetical protein
VVRECWDGEGRGGWGRVRGEGGVGLLVTEITGADVGREKGEIGGALGGKDGT